jgi:ubiquinone/menaquinone biosynthesis C-methylase UbiE
MEEHIKYFDNVADEWDSLFLDKKKIEEMVNKMNISSKEMILDVGCGTGKLIPFLQKKLKSVGLIYCLDFSIKMLLNAKKKNYSGVAKFIKGCAEKLPFKENRFTRIICLAVFPHIADKKTSVKEFHRILQTNGILNILHLMSREELNKFHKNLGGVLSKDVLPDEPTMKKILKECGFKNIVIINKPSTYFVQCIKI